MKVILTRASNLNRGDESRQALDLRSLRDLRQLLMQVEHPVVMMFARELDAPAEVEIMVYDDYIEHYLAVGDDDE